MLTDPNEIDIISRARQKNVQDPKRSREHFYHIFDDFFKGISFTEGMYIDLGAGQFDFAEIVRSLGGNCLGVDNDEAVIELGQYKGFEAIRADVKKLSALNLNRSFDGVFNKFTLNAFWFWNDDSRHKELIDSISMLMKPGAWAWIAPWNGIPKKLHLDKNDIRRVISMQINLFLEHGFNYINLTEKQSRYYGINGNIVNNIVFYKNLSFKS